MNLTAVIIDDEARSRRTLGHLIKEYCHQVQIVGEAEDVLSGVKVIQNTQPDIVFLDIEMPNYSGFQLIEYFDQINFDIIFTTAYEEYAIKAFKVSAIGYLLKPINIDELIAAVAKAERLRNKRQTQGQIAPSTEKGRRIILPAQNGMIYLNLDEICYLESEGRYARVHLIDGSDLLTTKSLKDCQDLLNHPFFLRVHRSYIINLSYIKKYTKGRESFVLMENKAQIDVGKNYKEELSRILSFFIK
ncbi:MAG: LytTR family DNA-binding domain-containing protein [Bacteroidota bacterium]